MSELTSNVKPESEDELLKIEKQLSSIDPKIFEGIKKEKIQRIIKSVVVTMHKTHSGPLPDPDTLAQYSEIIPNGAERIMLMAEKQLDHRIKMENKVVSGQLFQSNLGQILAFLIGLAALVSATYVIISGHEWKGVVLGVGGLTSLVTAFIKGKAQQTKDLENKSSQPRRR
jgi:uncharacterized membrane protein